MSVVARDFQAVNDWIPDVDGPKWPTRKSYEEGARYEEEPRYLIDKSTGRRYFNESTGIVRFKHGLLALGTPIVHGISAICNIAYRAFKLFSGCHFIEDRPGEKSYNFTARLKDAGKDFLKLVVSPLAIVGLELSTIYGLFRPYDGRKLYASIERATYGHFILAPCFQPNPQYHALGGDINEKDSF